MLVTAILFGFALITQASCKIILPPIPKLYGTSKCETNPSPALGIQCQPYPILTPIPKEDSIKAYNLEEPTFPTVSQAPFSVLGVQTRTLISSPYLCCQDQICNQNVQNKNNLIPQNLFGQVLPVIPQVVSNPTFTGIVEPSQAPSTYIAPNTDTIISPITPITPAISGEQENILITEDSTAGISEAFQQLLDELIESKLNGYTPLSAIAETPDVQLTIIEPEVNIDLVPEPDYKSSMTDQIGTINVLNDEFNSCTNCLPISEGQTISRILIPSEIPVQLICDITEIQALQPSLTYGHQPIAFGFC